MQHDGSLRAAGELRCWRKNGDLACIAHLDDDGEFDGVNTCYHPDGSLASRGEWRHGTRFGHFVFVRSEHDSPERYPEYDEGSWRVEFDATSNHSESNKHYFLKDGTECTWNGRPLATAFDLDMLFDASSPKDFVAIDGPRILNALFTHQNAPNKAMFEMLSIDAMPEDLGLDELFGYQDRHITPWLRLLAKAGTQFSSGPSGGSAAISPSRFSRCDNQNNASFNRNVMEWFLEQDDYNQYERLAQAFSGAFSLGGCGDCDTWYVGIFDDRGHGDESDHYSPQIYLWKHDSYGFGQPDFGSVDDFFWHFSINEARSQARLSEDAAQRANARQSVAPEEGLPNTQFFFWRAGWLIQLMSISNGDGRLRDAGDVFSKSLNQPIGEQLHQDLLKKGKTLPPTALYVMWRYFWFGHEMRLREALDAYRDAPARLTRDCTALIQELLEGRNRLPGIPDVRALRESLLALDLDPDRNAERAAEAVQRAAERAAEIAAKIAAENSAILALKDRGIDALIERAWDVVDDPIVLTRLSEEVRKNADTAPLFAALDWVKKTLDAEGYLVDEEMFADIGAWLGERDHRRIQPWLWSASLPNSRLLYHSLREPGDIHPRLIERALRQLGIAEEYNPRRELAATLLGRAHALRAIPGLLALFDEYRLTVGDRTDFELRLACVGWEDCLTSAAEALRTIHRAYPQAGTADTVARMYALAAAYYGRDRCEGHMMRKATVACLRTLGSLGDTRVLETIRSQSLMRENDGHFTAGLLLALRELACSDPTSHPAIIEIEPKYDSWEVRLAHVLMLRAAGKRLDMNDEIAKIENSDSAPFNEEEQLAYRMLLCEAVAQNDLPTERIADAAFSEHRDLREAALAAMRARNAEIPHVRVLSPIDANALVAEHGAEGALRALHDPNTVGLNYLLDEVRTRADWTGDRVAEALAEAAGRDLDRIPERDYAEPMKQTGVLLAELQCYSENNAVVALVARCLAHPSESIFRLALPLARPEPHAGAIVEGVTQRYAQTASAAAQWLTTHIDHPRVRDAIETAGFTVDRIAILAG